MEDLKIGDMGILAFDDVFKLSPLYGIYSDAEGVPSIVLDIKDGGQYTIGSLGYSGIFQVKDTNFTFTDEVEENAKHYLNEIIKFHNLKKQKENKVYNLQQKLDSSVKDLQNFELQSKMILEDIVAEFNGQVDTKYIEKLIAKSNTKYATITPITPTKLKISLNTNINANQDFLELLKDKTSIWEEIHEDEFKNYPLSYIENMSNKLYYLFSYNQESILSKVSEYMNVVSHNQTIEVYEQLSPFIRGFTIKLDLVVQIDENFQSVAFLKAVRFLDYVQSKKLGVIKDYSF